MSPTSPLAQAALFLVVAHTVLALPARAERFTLAQPHPFSFSGIVGTLLPVTAVETEGTRVCVSTACGDLEAGDQIFFRISLSAGSLPLYALAVGTNSAGRGGRAAYVDSGEQPVPSRAITFDFAPAFLFEEPGTLDANETTPVLLNAYADGGIGAILDAGTLLAVRGQAPQAPPPNVALGSVALARLDPPPSVSLEIVSNGFERPLYATSPPGDPRVFVVEQGGRIVVVPPSSAARPTFLTVPVALGFDDPFDERGLLGLAFAPDYATSGVFYIHYVAVDPADPDGPGRILVERRTVSADPNTANPTGTVLLSIPKPGPPATDPSAFEAYHNGGQLAFGPGGLLYVGIGDGGGWVGYDPWNCAQNQTSPFGKILRIDPGVLAAAPVVVAPAAQCPTFAQPTPNGITIWASGLRNPWRFSFDSLLGDLWIGDVGQSSREEIDFVASGSVAGGGPNFGWDVAEGTLCNGTNPAPAPACGSPALTAPLYEYEHIFDPFCSGSVVGGYLHRGNVSALRGKYVFGDTCQGFLRTLDPSAGNAIDDLPTSVSHQIDTLVSFGEGSDGQLYAVDWSGGAVYAFVPEPSASLLGAVAASLLFIRARRARRH